MFLSVYPPRSPAIVSIPVESTSSTHSMFVVVRPPSDSRQHRPEVTLALVLCELISRRTVRLRCGPDIVAQLTGRTY